MTRMQYQLADRAWRTRRNLWRAGLTRSIAAAFVRATSAVSAHTQKNVDLAAAGYIEARNVPVGERFGYAMVTPERKAIRVAAWADSYRLAVRTHQGGGFRPLSALAQHEGRIRLVSLYGDMLTAEMRAAA